MEAKSEREERKRRKAAGICPTEVKNKCHIEESSKKGGGNMPEGSSKKGKVKHSKRRTETKEGRKRRVKEKKGGK